MEWLLILFVSGHFQIAQIYNSQESCEDQGQYYLDKMSRADAVCITSDRLLNMLSKEE